MPTRLGFEPAWTRKACARLTLLSTEFNIMQLQIVIPGFIMQGDIQA
jgi:hypothetical protein